MELVWGKIVKSINWTFVANLVNFALLLYLMERFLYKPALKYLDRRRDRVAAHMEAARKSQEEAEQLAAQRREALQQAHDQARITVDEARAHAEEIIVAAKKDAKRAAERIIEIARRELAKERTEMEAELRRAYAELAVMGAARVLDREVKLDDHRKLLDELLAEVDAEAADLQS